MTLLDRLLGHDDETTRELLRRAGELSDEQLDQDFGIGHGTVRATFDHIVWNIECWTDLMKSRAVRSRDPNATPLAELTRRHTAASREFMHFARELERAGRLEQVFVDTLETPPAEIAFGGAIVHLATHGMHHRSQLLIMMRRLGLQQLPEGDALTWEASIRAQDTTQAAGSAKRELSPAVTIRSAVPTDAQAIADIYNEAIATTTATFDTQPKSEADRREWLAAHGERYPVFVAEVDGRVVGWAALTAWSDRCAYADTAETSFYVRQTHRGLGIGRALKEHLIQAARELGFHSLLARTAAGSDASLHLNQSMGFRLIGTMREVGLKFGQRLDVHLLQLMLSDGAEVPQA